MKKLLAVAVLATSAASFAADRAIYDLQYLPNAGTTYGDTRFSLLDREIETSGGGKTDVSGWDVQQIVGHSFSDRFSLQLDLDYIDAERDPKGGSKIDQTGISDPTLTGRYRFRDDEWRWDLIGGALVSLGDSKTKSNGDMDNRQGGYALFIGAQVGQKFDNQQWAFTARVTENMKRTEDVSGGTDTDIKSNTDLLLRADYLRNLSEKSVVNAHATMNFLDSQENDDTGANAVASHSDWELGAEYNHIFSGDFMAIAGVDYQTYNYDSGLVDSDDAWVFNIGARYQF